MEGLYAFGHAFHQEEWNAKFAESSSPKAVWLGAEDALPQDATAIFDFLLDEQPERLKAYADRTNLVVFGGGLMISLGEMAQKIGRKIDCSLIGINAWPTMLNRSLWEVSFYNENAKKDAEEVLGNMEIEFGEVQDRVGMATPRLLSMIINEASFTVQEGTATEADIDQAMSLGVNYPGGPFSWLASFGHERVIGLLQKMHSETGNGRYKIAPRLLSQGRRIYAESVA
ncbi:MAG: 3-hydroxyacyl-CoA dehydrogenase family protein [Bacteroidia bacterium]